MRMRIGIDFDNTIVCYDALFHRVALEGGWIPVHLRANKSDVRNHLRQIGRENVWTEMQGLVYGPRLIEATPFPGVREFFVACRNVGIPVFIVSHKTRTPFIGEPHDLHQAALDWLEAQGFFDPDQIALPRSHVFLELTKHAKLARIGACECTHFIDDLPEFLAEPSFPPGTNRILFDPNHLYGPEHPFGRLHAWSEAARLLEPHSHSHSPTSPDWGSRALGSTDPLGAPPSISAEAFPPLPVAEEGRGDDRLSFRPAEGPASAAAANTTADLAALVRALVPGSPEPITLDPLPGGANNRVYRVGVPSDPSAYVLKRYFQNPDDPRDRFGAEHAFYRWAQSRSPQRTPEPIAWDLDQRLAVFRFVQGRRLQPEELDSSHVDQAVAFLLELNIDRHAPEATSIPVASEACFSISEHAERIASRVERLSRFEPHTSIERQASSFIHDALIPHWKRVRENLAAHRSPDIETPLAHDQRCLSPSDFGFHNALLEPAGTLRFLDFEYAGWDDPAKLVCDFFCQPQVPVDAADWPRVVRRLGDGLGWGPALAHRAEQLLPAYRLKWCCILLNEFLRTGQARRAFASADLSGDDRKALQLAKARRAFDAIREDSET